MNNVVFNPNYEVEPIYFGPKTQSYRIGAHWKFRRTIGGHFASLVTVHAHYILNEYKGLIFVTGVLSGHRSLSEAGDILRAPHPYSSSYANIEEYMRYIVQRDRGKRETQVVLVRNKHRLFVGDRGCKVLDLYT